MKTETKTLITTNPAAIYALELELKKESPAYEELQAIHAEHGYTAGDITFAEHVLKPLRKKQPGVVNSALLDMYGMSETVARVAQLNDHIKYPLLHTPEALSAHLEEKVYEYTQNEKEAALHAFLLATNKTMIELGIAKRQRIELLETFGMDTVNTGIVRVWEFREAAQKCADRVQWNAANPEATPL